MPLAPAGESALGAAALTFHNGHDFKPTCMSSGHKGQGWPSLQPCLTLLGTVSSPWAFPVTLGSPAVVASWPHCWVGPGTQSWWRCCRCLCVTLGRSLHLSVLFSLSEKQETAQVLRLTGAWGKHITTRGDRDHRERGQRGNVAQHQGHAASSEPRTESPASPSHAVATSRDRYLCFRAARLLPWHRHLTAQERCL